MFNKRKKRIAELEKDAQVYSERIDNLINQKAQLVGEMDRLKVDIVTLTEECNKRGETIHSLGLRIIVLDQLVSVLEKKKQDPIDKADAQVRKDFATTINKQQKDILYLTESLKDRTEQIKELKCQNAQQKNQIAWLTAKNKKLQKPKTEKVVGITEKIVKRKVK